jgi:hypothetical protein
MANTKKIIADYFETGATLYCIIRRELDDYLLNDADGAFAAAPADPYVSMTENSTIKKRYELSESRTAWNDGVYGLIVYKQVGGSPAPVSDTLVASGDMVIDNDEEVILSSPAQIDEQLTASHGSGSWVFGGSILDMLVRFNMFEYKGDSDNVFSIVSGSFTGSIKFYTVSMADFIAGSTVPPLTDLVCTLNSDGTMSDTDDIDVDGEVLFFTIVGFEALENLVINFYNAALSTNTRFYIPKGMITVSASTPYYPTVSGTLFGKVSTLYSTPLTDNFINENIASLSDIDFDRIAQPVVVTQPTALINNVIQLNIIRDRTIDITFDLHRNITGDEIYFAMKSDRKSEYYDVEPILCTINDAVKGYISLTIPEDVTINLEISKYYGELMRKTLSGKYQTLVMFNIDLIPEIVSTNDI